MLKTVVAHTYGLHTRVAATAVDILSRCVPQASLQNVYLHARSQRVLLTDLMAVIALRVKCGESIGLSLEGNDESVLGPVMAYLGQSDQEGLTVPGADERIQQVMLTDQAILDNMTFGVIVVNTHNQISFLNRCAAEYLGLGDEYVRGRLSSEVIPEAKLNEVLNSLQPKPAIKHKVGTRVVLTTSSPVFAEGRLCGAVSVSQDISSVERLAEELETVKRMKGQYDLVFRTVRDGICLTDATGDILYVNPAYEMIHQISADTLVGKSVFSVSPLGLRAQVHRTGEGVHAQVRRKENGIDIVADVNPIWVDGTCCGALSVTRRLSEVEELLDQIKVLQKETKDLKEELHRQLRLNDAFQGIIGYSAALLDSLVMANKAARTQSNVLLTGESGTGKELVARAIHMTSERSRGPYIRVNCAGIPVSLIESELFGHERGAFTGAVSSRKGKFELAQNGTIFLDEIGELPLDVQSKLLRVIQERELQRVGGQDTVHLNVRVIAATNRDLEEEVRSKKFREDLYFRINVMRIHLPPLRHRVGDVLVLTEAFTAELAASMGKQVKGCTSEVMYALEHYTWPGNVRELRNVIERALNLCEGEWISREDLPDALLTSVQPAISPSGRQRTDTHFPTDEQLMSMSEYERRIISKALDLYPSFHAAGRALGLSHKTVARKARKYGLVISHQSSGSK